MIHVTNVTGKPVKRKCCGAGVNEGRCQVDVMKRVGEAAVACLLCLYHEPGMWV